LRQCQQISVIAAINRLNKIYTLLFKTQAAAVSTNGEKKPPSLAQVFLKDHL
jgi:hypothetical protein